MRSFTFQATLLVSVPVKAETRADAERKLRAKLAFSRIHVETPDDEPIVVEAEIEGDLDFLDASDCDDAVCTPHFSVGASLSVAFLAVG